MLTKEDFKGIWIPKEILEDDKVGSTEKMLLAVILALDKEDGCFASNGYFGKMLGLTRSRCSQIISSLKDKKYISIEYERDGKEIIKRSIKLVRKFNTVFNNQTEVVNNPIKGIKKTDRGYLENAKDITYIYNIKDNIKDNIDYIDRQLPTSGDSPQQDDDSKSEPESQPPIPYQEIIKYLNEKTGKNFNYKSTGNRKLIKARWNEGYKLEDFKQVIDNMASNWKGKTFSDGSPAEKYLRPQTLFKPSKFDDYLNATPNLAHEIKIHEHQIGQEDIEAYNYLKSTGKFKVKGDEELESP